MKKEDLPNDVNELKKLLINSINTKNREIALKDQQLTKKDQRILDLEDTIQLLRRSKFSPTSESNHRQLSFFNELEDIIDSDDEKREEKEQICYERKKRGKRKPIADNLPRIEKIVDLSEEEKKGLKFIGEDISEKIIVEPAKIYVFKTIKKKYAPIDNESAVITSEKGKNLLPKTMASSSLIAYIITAKYVDALPLYRQEKIFARISATLTRQTMARWLITVSKKLMPLYNLLEEKCLDSDYLQMDETTTQVLKENGKKATSKSYMWLRHRPGKNPIILYDYAPSRSGTVPIDLLEGFSGALQVDGYDGYAPVCEKNKLIRLGCMDHVRRKFFDAGKTSSGNNIGKKGLNLIDKLYKVEEQINMLEEDERHQARKEKSIPMLKTIKDWIDELLPKITPKSVAGKAINYAYNEWKYVERYVENPKYHMSNILIENAVRPFALGRKNWLFSASVEGAKASAMFFSIIETAKKNSFEPFDYLNKMLEQLPMAETVDDYEKILPLKDSFQIN